MVNPRDQDVFDLTLKSDPINPDFSVQTLYKVLKCWLEASQGHLFVVVIQQKLSFASLRNDDSPGPIDESSPASSWNI